jgi:hypothetical protein
MMDDDGTHLQVLNNFAALPVEGHEEEWKRLMALLNLRLGDIASVQLVLAKGTWRNANDPASYIRCAIHRIERKLRRPKGRELCIAELKLSPNDDDDGSFVEHDEAIDLLNDKTPMDSASTERYAMCRVQPKFLIPDSAHEDAECTVDYSKVMDEVARRAGLSKARRDWMEKVLVLRATAPISREQILSHPEVGSRKPLQAAWKWLDRNNELVSKVLSGQG